MRKSVINVNEIADDDLVKRVPAYNLEGSFQERMLPEKGEEGKDPEAEHESISVQSENSWRLQRVIGLQPVGQRCVHRLGVKVLGRDKVEDLVFFNP